jgi:hypothetical protein
MKQTVILRFVLLPESDSDEEKRKLLLFSLVGPFLVSSRRIIEGAHVTFVVLAKSEEKSR